MPVLQMSVWLLVACTYDNDKQVDPETQAILDVKTYVGEELAALSAASSALQASAPALGPWGAPEAAEMKGSWVEARVAYEHVEGAIAVLFPGLDASTDERYDGFLSEGADTYLFDGEGVIGVHAIERVLWSDAIPPEVVAFEEALPGYLPAAFPATEQEGIDFRELLCQRLTDDTATMEAEFGPLALDSAAAFRGVMGSMAEQLEKLNLAGSGEDESRYAQYTLGDMRANLDGGRAVYAAFQPWLEAEGAADLDADIAAGFGRVDAAYAAISGDAIPPVPATWNPDDPSLADLQTPYGQLWAVLVVEADPASPGSLLAAMTAAAEALGIPQLPE